MRSAWRRLCRFGRDRRGNISAMVALLIVPLVGVMGIATETGNWYLIQRSMQNAADAAVLAAATNNNTTVPGGSTSASYQLEGISVAGKFGYTTSNSTITVVNNDNTVPAKCAVGGVGTCYAVTITRAVPVYLTRIVGYSGSGGNQTIVAKAVALPQNTPTSYCLVSLAGPGNDDYHINGGPSIDLTGCNVLAKGDVTCNGANSSGKANSITHFGTNKNGNCAPDVQGSSSSPFTDPFSGQAANLPPSSCTPPANPTQISGTIDATGTLTGTNGVTYNGKKLCGSYQLTGNVTVTTSSPGSALVIDSGFLDLNGYTLTYTGGGLTIAFTGSTGGISSSMTGTFDFSSPGSGVWQGYSFYQDPNLPVTSSSASGNGLVWKISGIDYLPKTNLSFAGTIESATNGLDCFVLVDYTFISSGTGNVMEHQTQCTQLGVTLPSLTTLVRTTLIY